MSPTVKSQSPGNKKLKKGEEKKETSSCVEEKKTKVKNFQVGGIVVEYEAES